MNCIETKKETLPVSWVNKREFTRHLSRYLKLGAYILESKGQAQYEVIIRPYRSNLSHPEPK